MDCSKSFYKSVAIESVETWEYTPENGQKICIYEIGGNAAQNSNVRVGVIWGTEILFATHGDCVKKFKHCIEGDGVKKISIILINDRTDQAETIGCWLKADIY